MASWQATWVHFAWLKGAETGVISIFFPEILLFLFCPNFATILLDTVATLNNPTCSLRLCTLITIRPVDKHNALHKLLAQCWLSG